MSSPRPGHPASPALAIGKFDALHLGHRALVAEAARHGRPTLLSFAGMAEELGWRPRAPLVAPADRQRVLDEWGAAWVSLPFSEVRPLPPGGFIHLLRERFRPAAVVVGEDFRFGVDRSGSVADLRRIADFAVAVVPPVMHDGAPVSSSRVREALARGDAALAAACLGRPHRLLGTVVRGAGRGRTIGVPTANLGGRESCDPAPGVYAAWAHLAGHGRLPAGVNVGHAPTAGADLPLTVEAHLIGFAGDCYGARLGLDLIARLRDERRFASLAELAAQIARDIAAARARFVEHG